MTWDTELYLILRIVNAVLGLLLLAYMLIAAPTWRHRIDLMRLGIGKDGVNQLKLIGYAMVLNTAINTYATIESAARRIPGGFRTWLITLSLLTMLAAFCWPALVRIARRLRAAWRGRRTAADRRRSDP